MTNTDREEMFAGHEGRECGEHRPVSSGRAWCFDCKEWCYPDPDMACVRCEVPVLRQRIENQGREIERYREALTRIGEHAEAVVRDADDRQEALLFQTYANVARTALQSPTQAPLQGEPGGPTVGK